MTLTGKLVRQRNESFLVTRSDPFRQEDAQVLMFVHRQASVKAFARFGNRTFVPSASIICISGRFRSMSMKPATEKPGNI